MHQHLPAHGTPVIVIDLQTGMFDGVAEQPIHGAIDLVARVRAVLEWARRTKHPVAFVRHDGPEGDPLAPGSPGWLVWPALGQAEDEPTFAKNVGDAFSNAALAEWVRQQQADEVILLGAQTDQCVAASVAGAFREGFRATVVADAHSTCDFGGESAPDIIARHNAGFAAKGVNLLTTDELTTI